MEPLTLFTWGYWGWGSATKQFVEAVDAVETSRGFKPPMFVDIRLSRSVRAPGFDGAAFEHAVGSARYRWLDALGNVAIKAGGAMRIKDPAAADTLLDIAEQCARDRQRVIFFCACEFPGPKSGTGCHRVTVARLVLDAAQRRKTAVQVAEWPGGEPEKDGFTLQLTGPEYAKVSRGATTIPLSEPVPIAEFAAVPWCSQLFVQNEDDEAAPYFHFLTGPAKYKKGGWCLPIYKDIEPEATDDQVRDLIRKMRLEVGFTARHSKV